MQSHFKHTKSAETNRCLATNPPCQAAPWGTAAAAVGAAPAQRGGAESQERLVHRSQSHSSTHPGPGDGSKANVRSTSVSRACDNRQSESTRPFYVLTSFAVPKGDPKRGTRPTNHLKVIFQSLKSKLFSGSPFSDPPFGGGESCASMGLTRSGSYFNGVNIRPNTGNSPGNVTRRMLDCEVLVCKIAEHHHHYHPEGLAYRGFRLNSVTFAVTEIVSRRWRCIKSLFPDSDERHAFALKDVCAGCPAR